MTNELPTPLREKCEELAENHASENRGYDFYNTYTGKYEAEHMMPIFKDGFQSCWQEVEPFVKAAQAVAFEYRESNWLDRRKYCEAHCTPEDHTEICLVMTHSPVLDEFDKQLRKLLVEK